MKKILCLILLFFVFNIGYSQEANEPVSEEKVTGDQPEKKKLESTKTTDEDKDPKDEPNNQGKIREQKRWMLSLGSSRSIEFRAEYNINSRFTFGGQVFRQFYRDYKDFRTYGATVYEEDNKFNRKGFELFGKYFVFSDGPIYAILGVGKYVDGGMSKNTLLFTRTSTNLQPNIENITSITTFNPYWYYRYGAGFQWIFKIGIFFNVEATSSSPINIKKNTYTYFDTRSLVTNNNYNFTNLYLVDKSLKTENPESGLFQFNIWLGYAFSF